MPLLLLQAMTGRTDRQLQMNHLSLKNKWLKLKTSGNSHIGLEEYREYTPNRKKKGSKRCQQHVTDWTWKQQDLDRVCPKLSPETAYKLQKLTQLSAKIQRITRKYSPLVIKQVAKMLTVRPWKTKNSDCNIAHHHVLGHYYNVISRGTCISADSAIQQPET